jgi:lipoprotein-anchoring transpeptidase ErfK/SrfK
LLHTRRRSVFVALVALCVPGIAIVACGERKNAGEGAAVTSSASSPALQASAASVDTSAGDAMPSGDPARDAAALAPSKPQLTTKLQSTWIWEKPRLDSQQIGYFRAGARLTRAADPYEGKDAQPCGPAGSKWYAVLPVGYVCESKDSATLDLADPSAMAAAAYPPKDEPLPYAYGMSFASPMYARVPTVQEQNAAEGDVEYWRKTIAAVRAKTPPEKLGPELAMPVGEMPAFLQGHAQAPAILPWLVPNKTARAGYALPSTRLAFVAAFESEGRNFYLTSELMVVPADRFKVAHAQDFRGVELGDASENHAAAHLPMIWARYPTDKQPAFVYELRGETLTKTTTQLALQSHFEIAQQDVMVKGVRHHELTSLPSALEAKDDVRYVVRTTDVTRVNAVKAAPDGVAADEYWIDVDLGRQALVAYRGATPTYVTLVSSGSGGKGHFTPTGAFRIYQKHWTARMSADEKPAEKEGEDAERSYRFDDVPWVQYLYAGIALHAAFWHDSFGQPRSHGCINLSPYDARYLFKRTLPALPEAWHGINGGRAGIALGTLVVVHG